MDDLTKCLYHFVWDRRMRSVYADPEYAEVSHSIDLQTEKVKKDLDETQRKELSRLLDGINALSSIESEHMFRVTLRLARELSTVTGTA